MGLMYETQEYVQRGYSPERRIYTMNADDYQPDIYYGLYASGGSVRRLQEWLNLTVFRFGNKIRVDGLYGEQTRRAVKKLQKFLNLTFGEHLKVDGLYGCRTYLAALRHYKQAGWLPPPPPIPKWAKGCGGLAVGKPQQLPVKPVYVKKDSSVKTGSASVASVSESQPQSGIDKKTLYIGGGILAGLIALMLIGNPKE
jgi:hypothetical protein